MLTTPVGAGRAGSRGLHQALLQLALTAALLCAVETAIILAGPLTPAWVGTLFPVAAGVYFGFGLLAWMRRPSNHLGAVLTAGGLVFIAAGLLNTDVPILIAVGAIF